MIQKIVSIAFLSPLVFASLYGQDPQVQPQSQPADTSAIVDAAYLDKNTSDRKFIPYPSVRDADVLYKQRLWRAIDLREKANFHLYYPLEPQSDVISLFDLLKREIASGKMVAYKADLGPNKTDDKFTEKITAKELDRLFLLTEGDIETDENGRELLDPTTGKPIRDDKPMGAEHLVQYKIKEDWFFDKHRSRMDFRIIGLAPMRPLYDPTDKKKVIGYAEMYWVYFPAIRETLARNNALNVRNGGQKRTYDDIFHKRIFTSYVVKTDLDNPFDRNIGDYRKGLDALLESEKIKKHLFNYEHDLWEY
jgi:gliding motility associated protien GldN